MSWRDLGLGSEEVAIVDLVSRLVGDRGPLTDADSDLTDALRRELGELGLWVPEADDDSLPESTQQLVLIALGGAWPALGWASAQTRAALTALDLSSGPAREIASSVRSEHGSIAVVDSAALGVQLQRDGDRVTGSVLRIDPAADPAGLLVLDGSNAYVVPAESLADMRAVRTVGLDGARTMSVDVEGVALAVDGAADLVRRRLWRGATAVVAGIAREAAGAALSYAAAREQFGGPLTAIPAVQVALQRQSALVATALTAALHPDLTDLSHCAGVLATTCDAAVEVTAGALQAHGGYGYLTEYPVERSVRAALAVRASVDAFGAGVRGGLALTGTTRS